MASMTQEQITNVKNWVFALRSGYYEQTMMRLKDNLGRYCCLGVAASVLGKTFIKHLGGPSGYDGYIDDTGKAHTTQLGDIEASELGLDKELTDSEREFLGERIQPADTTRMMALVGLNDKGNLSFDEIADMIELLGWDGGSEMTTEPVEEKEMATEPVEEKEMTTA